MIFSFLVLIYGPSRTVRFVRGIEFEEESVEAVPDNLVADLKGVNVTGLDVLDEDGKTPLMNAATYAQWEAARHLCRAGSDMSIALPDGSTALHIAAERGFTHTVKELLGCKNADVNHTTKKGKSALSSAVVGGFDEVVRVLLAAGADASTILKDGKSVLMIAHTKLTAELLISYGADPNFADKEGNTPLMFAAALGENDILRAMLAGNANPDTVNAQGFSALMFAASRGHTESISVLAEGGASVDLQDMYGSTALQLAVRKGAKQECLDMLIEVGAIYRGTGMVNPTKDVLIRRRKFAEKMAGEM